MLTLTSQQSDVSVASSTGPGVRFDDTPHSMFYEAPGFGGGQAAAAAAAGPARGRRERHDVMDSPSRSILKPVPEVSARAFLSSA